MKQAEVQPKKAETNGRRKKSAEDLPARTVVFADSAEDLPVDVGNLDAGAKKKSAAKTGKKTGRAKAKKPNEKITPASILRKMLAFGKAYQIESEQDFIEAARIYAEEAGLIDQMRDQIA